MIHATKLLRVALSTHAKQIATMNAAVNESVDVLVGITRYQDRYFADGGGDKVAGFG